MSCAPYGPALAAGYHKDELARCNSGHVSPKTLWVCPACHEADRDRLTAGNARLRGEVYLSEPKEIDERTGQFGITYKEAFEAEKKGSGELRKAVDRLNGHLEVEAEYSEQLKSRLALADAVVEKARKFIDYWMDDREDKSNEEYQRVVVELIWELSTAMEGRDGE